jgi:NAD-dependent SIR2 family protein deacetylase
LLAKKKLLLRSYTQNIDMLERLTGIDEELLVEAHGSFATSKCIKCSLRSESGYVKSMDKCRPSPLPDSCFEFGD